MSSTSLPWTGLPWAPAEEARFRGGIEVFGGLARG